MNILVVGANGQTGRQVIKKLQESNQYAPIAGLREEEQVKKFQSSGIDARLIDVREKVSQIAKKLTSVDAIVVTVGAGEQGSSTLVDLDGKVKVAEAAEQVNIKRFILISAGGVHHFHDDKRFKWMDDLEEYSAAMYYSDRWVENSNLDYTIIRPGQLTNESGTGTVQIGDYLPHENIAREDVASTVVATIDEDRTIGKAFDIIGGNSPIIEGVKNWLVE